MARAKYRAIAITPLFYHGPKKLAAGLAVFIPAMISRGAGCLWPFALFVPTLSLVAGAWIYLHPGSIKTEKGLIACYYRQPENGAAPLIYLDDAPFSARYYSQEKVREKSLDLILREVKNSPGRSLYVAVQPDDLDRFKRQLSAPFVKIFENRRYVLMTQSDRAVVTCR